MRKKSGNMRQYANRITPPQKKFTSLQGKQQTARKERPKDGDNGQRVNATMEEEEEEEEEMRSPGRAHPRHIPMVPAGPLRSGRDREGGYVPTFEGDSSPPP